MFFRNLAQAATARRPPSRSSSVILTNRRSLSTPPPSHFNNYPRWRKFGRRSAYVAVSFGALWFLDREFNASAVGRNFRTLWAVSVHSWTRSPIRNPRWFWNQRAVNGCRTCLRSMKKQSVSLPVTVMSGAELAFISHSSPAYSYSNSLTFVFYSSVL